VPRRLARTPPAHRLLVVLPLGPILARLGPGARLVALISAAHAGRVALIWPARAGRRWGQERLKRGLFGSKQRCPPGSTTGGWIEHWRTRWGLHRTAWSSGWTRTSGRQRSRLCRPTRSSSVAVGSAPTATATPPWPGLAGNGRTVSGRSRDVRASVSTGQHIANVSWPTVNGSSTCRRSCRRGYGSSPPGRAVRPTLPTATDGYRRLPTATDAHFVALVGTRMTGLRPVVNDEQLAVLRILVDRRRSLGEDHTRMVSQLHQLLLELIPGGAKKDLSARQAKALLAKVRPRDAAGKTRRRVAAELSATLNGSTRARRPPTRSSPTSSPPPGPG
jgi:hypothetical protein